MTRKIPRHEWRDELDSFSKQHEGWIVSVKVAGANGAIQTEARELPLQGVSADSPANNCVDIMIGERAKSHVTHVVDPVDVSIDLTDEGAERALRIRGADGSTTTIEFRSPMRAADVDGMPAR
jgi:Family of unknown function (DUF5335)